MSRYFALSCGLHLIGFLCLLLTLAPAAKQVSATYTIDFIGSGKVVATTGQEAPAPAKTAVAAPAPAKEAIPQAPAQPAKKAYAAKAEITEKPAKPTSKKVAVEEPLAAPSILADEADASLAKTGGTPSAGQGDEPGGDNIQTDFANFPFPWYATQVRNSLWLEWEKRRPVGTNHSAVIIFSINRNGSIKDLYVGQSSGDDSFDFLARTAVLKSGPFNALPMEYEKDELVVAVELKEKS